MKSCAGDHVQVSEDAHNSFNSNVLSSLRLHRNWSDRISSAVDKGEIRKQDQVGKKSVRRVDSFERLRYQPTHQPTNRRTLPVTYRGALAHLKKQKNARVTECERITKCWNKTMPKTARRMKSQ